MLWMTFYDPKKRGAAAFLGVVVAPIEDPAQAMLWALDHGISANAVSEYWTLTDPVPPEYVARVLNREEVNKLNDRMSHGHAP